MKTFRRLSAPGGSALSIWELQGLRGDLAELFGKALPLPQQPLRLDRTSLPFDEILLWCRRRGGDSQASWCLECHLHGGYGVATAFRAWMSTHGWRERRESAAKDPDSLLCGANSPLAARVIGPLREGGFAQEMQRIRGLPTTARAAAIHAVARWNGWADAIESPPQLVLAGPPNTGKSTLFNLWNRAALVTTHEGGGTTRDLVSSRILLGTGAERAMFLLLDSAGLGAARGPLDQQAMRMTLDTLPHAWSVLWVLDTSSPPTEALLQRVRRRGPRDLVLLHRTDLEPGWEPEAAGVHPDLRGHVGEGDAWPQRIESAVLRLLGPPPPPGAIVALGSTRRQALTELQQSSP